MKSLLFLVALRNSVRSQAKIIAVVRKTFGTTIKLHLRVGSVIFSLVNSVLPGVAERPDFDSTVLGTFKSLFMFLCLVSYITSQNVNISQLLT